MKCDWNYLHLIRCADDSGWCGGVDDELCFHCLRAAEFDWDDGRMNCEDARPYCYYCILRTIEQLTIIHWMLWLLGSEESVHRCCLDQKLIIFLIRIRCLVCLLLWQFLIYGNDENIPGSVLVCWHPVWWAEIEKRGNY